MAENNTVVATQSRSITLTPNTPLTLSFNPSEATFSANGENLIIEFENGNVVNLVNYKSLAENGELPAIVFADGQQIPGDSYLSTFDGIAEEELETAAGAAGGQGGSGSGDYNDDAGSLFDGIGLIGGQGDPSRSLGGPIVLGAEGLDAIPTIVVIYNDELGIDGSFVEVDESFLRELGTGEGPVPSDAIGSQSGSFVINAVPSGADFLTINGVNVDLNTANTTTISSNDGDLFVSVLEDGSVSWLYVLTGTDGDDRIDSFTVTVTSNSGVQSNPAQLAIAIVDDVPEAFPSEIRGSEADAGMENYPPNDGDNVLHVLPVDSEGGEDGILLPLYTLSGPLSIDFGADAAASNNPVTLAMGLEDNFWSWDDTTATLNYYQNGDGELTWQIEVIDRGNSFFDYEYRQYTPIDHDDTTRPDEVAFYNIQLTATDGDGDSSTSSISLGIADDGPTIYSRTVINVDETNANVNAQGPILTASGIFNIDFGTDGPHDDTPITLSMQMDPNSAEGYTWDPDTATLTYYQNGTTAPATWEVIVTKSFGETFNYQFNQLTPVDHANPNRHNEVERFDIKVTAMDGDGDTTDKNMAIRLRDDGPQAQRSDARPLTLTLDESPIPENGDGVVTTTSDFSSLFVTGTNVDYGTDGPGSVSYSLNLKHNDAQSGLFTLGVDGAPGPPILLTQSGNTITGYSGSVNYFTITIDPATGVVSFSQLANIYHDNDNNHDDPATLHLQRAGHLQVIQTVTDADNDTSVAKVNLGRGVFTIEDDGPSATVNETLSFTVEFKGGSAGYNNSYGYYIKGEDGQPETGVVIWDNVKNFRDIPTTITLAAGVTPDDVGFFIIPNGDRANPSLAPGTEITFSGSGNTWQAFAGATPLTGTGANVYFDNKDWNSDSANHLVNNNVVGSQNWEDLWIPRDDGDFNDVNIKISWNNGPLILDESDLPIPPESPVVNDGVDDGVHAVRADFSSFFAAPDYGTDGPGSVSYQLTLGGGEGGVGSGVYALDSTQPNGQGAEIQLFMVGTSTIEGRVGNELYFTIELDGSEVVFTLNEGNIWHPENTNVDEAVAILTGPNTLQLVQTVTDADDDTAQAALDLGQGYFRIEDDGPQFIEPGQNSDNVLNLDVMENGTVYSVSLGDLAQWVDTGTDEAGAHLRITDLPISGTLSYTDAGGIVHTIDANTPPVEALVPISAIASLTYTHTDIAPISLEQGDFAALWGNRGLNTDVSLTLQTADGWTISAGQAVGAPPQTLANVASNHSSFSDLSTLTASTGALNLQVVAGAEPGLGLGIGNDREINNSEFLVFEFGRDMVEGTIEVDGMAGHFDNDQTPNSGHKEYGRAMWKAYNDGELVGEGFVQHNSDDYNNNGGLRSSAYQNTINIDGIVFDTLVLYTGSTATNTDFVVTSMSMTPYRDETEVNETLAFTVVDGDGDTSEIGTVHIGGIIPASHGVDNIVPTAADNSINADNEYIFQASGSEFLFADGDDTDNNFGGIGDADSSERDDFAAIAITGLPVGGTLFYKGEEVTEQDLQQVFDPESGTYFNGLVILSGEFSNLRFVDDNPESDTFLEYRVQDGVGAWSNEAQLDLINTTSDTPVFIVGSSDDDQNGSTAEFTVAPNPNMHGEIIGSTAQDILVGDVGGSTVTETSTLPSTNYVLLMDVSGSMGGNRITDLENSVKNLLDSTYNKVDASSDGLVQISLIPFSSNVKTGASVVFDKVNDSIVFNNGTNSTTINNAFSSPVANALNIAKAWVTNLNASGLTNYEAPLDSGIANLNANTNIYDQQHVLFLTDGAPNRRFNDNDQPAGNGGANKVVRDIFGDSDNFDEVTEIQDLANSVRVVGISINAGANLNGNNGINVTLGSGTSEQNINLKTRGDLLNTMDSTGTAIILSSSTDLSTTLQEITDESLSLAALGDDHLRGGDSGDLIFGDILNTDALAAAQGVDLPTGSGWQVFEELESGGTGWTRDDTLDYIRDNQDELKTESLDSNQSGRVGGNDIINGGKGEDIIFAQEGNDIVFGGEGSDTIDAGSGDDIVIVSQGDMVTLGEGEDTIHVSEDMLSENGEKVTIADFDVSIDNINIDFNDASTSLSTDGTELTISQVGSSKQLVLDFGSTDITGFLPGALTPEEQQTISDLVNQNG